MLSHPSFSLTLTQTTSWHLCTETALDKPNLPFSSCLTSVYLSLIHSSFKVYLQLAELALLSLASLHSSQIDNSLFSLKYHEKSSNARYIRANIRANNYHFLYGPIISYILQDSIPKIIDVVETQGGHNKYWFDLVIYLFTALYSKLFGI